MSRSYWEHFQHQADIGVRGIGNSLAEAFEQAAQALMAVITAAPITAAKEFSVTCAAADPELLLADWLNQLIYLVATEQMLFSRFAVTILHNRLTAVIAGEHIDRQRHSPAVEIKAATYSELCVAQTVDGRWLAQCVVDV